jgi:hypothetical protein
VGVVDTNEVELESGVAAITGEQVRTKPARSSAHVFSTDSADLRSQSSLQPQRTDTSRRASLAVDDI